MCAVYVLEVLAALLFLPGILLIDTVVRMFRGQPLTLRIKEERCLWALRIGVWVFLGVTAAFAALGMAVSEKYFLAEAGVGAYALFLIFLAWKNRLL